MPTNRINFYLATNVRELDRQAIEVHGIPGFTLMQRAGKATFDALLEHWPETQHLLCFCGGGNNGGDGYVIAALARMADIDSHVVWVSDPGKLSGDAALARDMAVANQVPFHSLAQFLEQHDSLKQHTTIVDALLGTGLTGPARGDYATAVSLINQARVPVVAVDIPSSLDSDTGAILGEAVKADITVTFIGRKLGQAIKDGPAQCGKIVFDDLGVPGEIYETVSPVTP